MGLETAAAVGGLGLLGGAVKGAKGTPASQTTTQSSIAPASAQEQALQSQSLSNYNQANALAGQYEQQVGGAQSYQDLARQAGGNILNGSAFNVTPEEQQRIQSLRDALIQQGTANVGYNTQQGLNKVANSAAGRGLRGQALGELQGQVLQGQQRVVGDVANQANTTAAQAYLAAPGQRIAAQQNAINQGMSLADTLRQQAITNRTNLQDPALMAYLQRERQSNQTQTSTTPGQRGGIAGALGGALGGLGQGVNIGTGVAGAFNNLGAAERLRGSYLGSGGGYTGNQDVLGMRDFYMNQVS